MIKLLLFMIIFLSPTVNYAVGNNAQQTESKHKTPHTNESALRARAATGHIQQTVKPISPTMDGNRPSSTNYAQSIGAQCFECCCPCLGKLMAEAISQAALSQAPFQTH